MPTSIHPAKKKQDNTNNEAPQLPLGPRVPENKKQKKKVEIKIKDKKIKRKKGRQRTSNGEIRSRVLAPP